MNTQESNKIIAEFLQIPKCGRCEDCGGYQYSPASIYQPEDMKYHTSWDWLMPVVEKIRIWCWNKYNCTDKMGEIFRGMHMTDIVRTHTSIIQFIQWYNTHNKK